MSPTQKDAGLFAIGADSFRTVIVSLRVESVRQQGPLLFFELGMRAAE